MLQRPGNRMLSVIPTVSGRPRLAPGLFQGAENKAGNLFWESQKHWCGAKCGKSLALEGEMGGGREGGRGWDEVMR